MTPQQYQALLRQQLQRLQNAERQRIAEVNRQIDQFNRAEKARVDAHNREVRRANEHTRRVINQYNADVQRHNAAVLANRQRIARAISALRQPTIVVRPTFRVSVEALNEDFSALARENHTAIQHQQRLLVDLPERENANSLEVLSALSGAPGDFDDAGESEDFGPALAAISPELLKRWIGAKRALNPENPEAARHFCSSVREIFTRILELRAPSELVLREVPQCDKAQDGAPTRRARMQFALQRKRLVVPTLVTFADSDITNIVELFKVLNSGTHGESGHFTMPQLLAIQRRVEDGIVFLIEVMS